MERLIHACTEEDGMETAQQLHGIIDAQLASSLEFDGQIADSPLNPPERREKGVFFGHVTLARFIVAQELVAQGES